MKIEARRSNFSQFSDDLWMVAEHDGAKIDFDIYQAEMRDFALMMLDVAYDCLSKLDEDRAEEQEAIVDLMGRLNAEK